MRVLGCYQCVKAVLLEDSPAVAASLLALIDKFPQCPLTEPEIYIVSLVNVSLSQTSLEALVWDASRHTSQVKYQPELCDVLTPMYRERKSLKYSVLKGISLSNSLP